MDRLFPISSLSEIGWRQWQGLLDDKPDLLRGPLPIYPSICRSKGNALASQMFAKLVIAVHPIRQRVVVHAVEPRSQL
jgi:hypothetical protein